MNRLRNQDGQVTVLVGVLMVALVGMAALVIDVGSWFRTQRATQSMVDAAALAGAQALPGNTVGATTLAKSYADKNSGAGSLADTDITFSSTYQPNDTIKITKAKPAGGFFGSVLGISAVTVHAHARAMIGVPTEAQYVAPVAVNITHPDLHGTPGCPCFGPSNTTTLPLGKTGAPGAFDLIDLEVDQTSGTVGASTMASWIQNGFTKYLPLGGYFSDPGAKYNGNEIDNALAARIGTDLLFPVYDTLIDTGSNASYHVIAWVGFHLLPGSYLQGNSGQLVGYFTQVIWQGLLPTGGPSTAPDLGVDTVALVD
jgi:hypothetical protein